MATMEITSRADLLGLMREALAELVREQPQLIVDALGSNQEGVRAQLERLGFLVGGEGAQGAAANPAADVAAAYREAQTRGVILTGFGARFRQAVRSVPYHDPRSGRERRTYLHGEGMKAAEAWFRAFFSSDKTDPVTNKSLRALFDEVQTATRAPAFTMTGEAGTGGGFLVPTAIAAEIFMEVSERFVLQGLVEVFTSATPLQIPRSLGRVTISRGPVASDIPEKDAASLLGAVTLTPQDVFALSYVEPKLALAAVVGPVRYVISKFAEALAYDKQRVIVAGDPSLREPRGLTTIPISGGSVLERAKTATFSNTDNQTRRDSIRTGFYRVPQGHRESDRFVWIVNGEGMAKMASVNDANQAPFKDAGNGQSATYLNKRIVETEAVLTSGGNTSILGGDMGQYAYQEHPGGLTIAQTTEGGQAWTSNTIGVKMIETFDGAPVIPTAFLNIPSVAV